MAPALVFALTFAAPGRAAPAPDSLVRALVAQVSAESIRQTIQALQDMGTRYSYAPGCSLAGEHVLRRFRQAGADADYHGYAVPALAVELRLLPGGHGWLADTLGTLLHTSDGGEAWTERLGLDYHHLFGLDFADSLRGWAVGQSVFGGSGVVLHTSDGGMNWAVQTSFPLARLNRVAFASRDRGWAAGASRDSAIVARTGDGGRTWSVAGLGLRGEMRDLCATGGNRVWAVGLARGPAQGLVFHSGDGGASWREQLRTAGRLDAVCFVDSGNGWAAGADPAGSPALFRTATGGADWSACPPDSGFGLRDVGFSDREHGWCAGDSGFAYRTADAGTTWTSRRLGRRGLQAVRTADSLTAWFAGEGDTVLITTDAGASWRGRSPRGPLVWRNVLGTFRGSTAPDTVWMASAHHDCYSTEPMRNAPGADDDASGAAAVIEAARVLGRARLALSVAFATFSGEEQNFIGSTRYVEHILPGRPNIAGLVNLDMVGFREREWAVDVIADSGSEPLADSFAAAARGYVPGLGVRKVVDPGMRYWDSNAFWDAGYRAVTVVEREFNPAYHTPGDTLGLLTPEYAADVARALVATLALGARCLPAGLEEEPGPGAPVPVLVVRPNPGGRRTRVEYAIAEETDVVLAVLDAAGRVVRVLEQGRRKPGRYRLRWDGRDDRGSDLAAGVYFCRLTAGARSRSGQLVLAR